MKSLKKNDFYFELPEELIAQTPIERRDGSRLMLLDKLTGKTEHRRFYELPDILREGDCLVLNDSRVLPARLMGRRESGGGGGVSPLTTRTLVGGDTQVPAPATKSSAEGELNSGGVVEVVLLRDLGGGMWECLTRPGKKTAPGTKLSFGDDELTATVRDVAAGGNRIIEFHYDGIFIEVLERLGKMPLPPYIKAELDDPERYQTVYSRESGSAAAPTAGLHFTVELLDKLRAKGVTVCFVTLHVGLGTFRPVKAENIEDHEMHAEYCEIPAETARAVNDAKSSGNRVIAVGTTSLRTLESFSKEAGTLDAVSGWTDIFIYPGYKFKCVDGLITNFHLPESTLIMLVSALTGRERVLTAYNEAIGERYRFFSFGDAMAIL